MNWQHRIEQIFGKLTEDAQGKGQPTNALPDFKDRNSTGSNEYAYDANGNISRDDNKGINNIV